MDVKKSEWKTKAIENITQYMTTRGDEDDHLIGNELRNTIGCAMGLLPSIPETEDEIRQAQDGKFCFYKDKSLEAIEVIKKKIYEYTPDKVKVCVLPIEFYSNEKLYELPLFRIVNKSGKYRFIDNCGRYYKSFNDFLEENKLPPGKMMYPRNGHLTPNKDDKNLADCVCDETPSASIKTKAVKVAYTGVMIAGIGAGVASIFTGGLAIPIIAGAAAVYGLGRSTYQVVDRAQHDDSLNPFTNSEARMLWLGIAANVASFGAMGASMKLSMMAANGKEITAAFKIVVNSLNGTSLAISSGATLNNVIFMIDNIDKMSPLDITLQCISIAFWAKGAFQFKTAGMIIKDAHNQVFNSITKNLDDNSKANINNFRNDIKNDAQLIRFIRNSKTDPAKTLLALNEMATVYEVLDNGNQRLLSYELLENGMVRLNSGSEVEMSTLLSLNSDHRSIIIEGLYGLDKKQTDAFNKLRAHINDDAKLFQSLAMHNNMKGCTFKESVASLIKFLGNMNQPNGNQNGAGGAGGLVSMKFVI